MQPVLMALAFAAQAPPAPVPTDTLLCFRAAAAPDSGGPLCRALTAEVERPNVVRQHNALTYPAALRVAGVEGEVILRVIVDTMGRIEPASLRTVLASHADFDAAARAWIEGVEFRPARWRGRAVRVLIDLPLRFSLSQPAATDDSEQLLAAARAQFAAHKLDSAAALLEQVAQGPARARGHRIEAWVWLGIVGFYREGDVAAAAAFREALALDPVLQAPDLARSDPVLAGILEAERAARQGAAAAAAPPAEAPQPVYDCVAKCPEGVRPPRFVYFPQLTLLDADPGVRDRQGRTSSYLILQAVIGANGALEIESLVVSGGTARGMEGELRRGLAEARFAPGRAPDGAPARTRVALRFDFEAEGSNTVRYTYRVVAR